MTRNIQITPQFGPFNVNNPQVLLRNGSYSRTWETNRIGPSPLPIFTPPPRPSKPFTPGKVQQVKLFIILYYLIFQQYGGPDFPTQRPYIRVTVPPSRVRTIPPWTTTLKPSTSTDNSDQINVPTEEEYGDEFLPPADNGSYRKIQKNGFFS